MPVSKLVLHHRRDHTVVFSAEKERRQKAAHLKVHLRTEWLLSTTQYLLLVSTEAKGKKKNSTPLGATQIDKGF